MVPPCRAMITRPWSWRCNGNGAFGTMVDLQTFTCEFSNCEIRCVDEGCSEDQTADVARRMATIATALKATVRFTINSFRSKRSPNENSTQFLGLSEAIPKNWIYSGLSLQSDSRKSATRRRC